jgi:hypothetical protein
MFSVRTHEVTCMQQKFKTILIVGGGTAGG